MAVRGKIFQPHDTQTRIQLNWTMGLSSASERNLTPAKGFRQAHIGSRACPACIRVSEYVSEAISGHSEARKQL